MEELTSKSEELQEQSTSNVIDWGQVIIPEAKSQKINQTAWIDPQSYVWFIVACRLMKKPASDVVRSAVVSYLQLIHQKLLNILKFIAARESLSLEETIIKVFRGEIDV